jgi:choline dehydrogenase
VSGAGPPPSAIHDVVIVGAGSAGCVLAARLSEDSTSRVLLLEAGGTDDRREMRIPAAFSRLFRSAYDWADETEPQPALAGRPLYWPRGKCLGGSSSINAMIYVRGHPRDYDGWAAAGNAGWAWADVLPYFRRAEDQARGASELHGAGGPLRVEDLRTVNPLSRAFVEAAVARGLARNADFNGPEQDGAGVFQVTQRRGRRWSCADAYLRPALGRPNLRVATGAHATRVVLEGGRAVAVRYLRDGLEHEARAAREVIVTAGAVGSPHLLLLSGIGPADHLRALGVPVALDLPGVGENLHDHLAVGVAYECREPVSLASAASPANLARWLLARRGPLTSCVAEAGAFVCTRPALPAPDLQIHFGAAYFIEHGLANPPGHGFTFGPTLLRPASRGRVRLRARDPLAAAAIDPGYLADPADLAALVAGIRLSRRIATARPFDRYRGREVSPGPDAVGDLALAEHVRQRAQTLYHPVGTCRMGSDRLAVVDARLRVRGVDGLRVVDASVMPAIVGGNTNAPTIMLAERAADLLRADAR